VTLRSCWNRHDIGCRSLSCLRRSESPPRRSARSGDDHRSGRSPWGQGCANP
jgi:hypothetical protein